MDALRIQRSDYQIAECNSWDRDNPGDVPSGCLLIWRKGGIAGCRFHGHQCVRRRGLAGSASLQLCGAWGGGFDAAVGAMVGTPVDGTGRGLRRGCRADFLLPLLRDIGSLGTRRVARRTSGGPKTLEADAGCRRDHGRTCGTGFVDGSYPEYPAHRMGAAAFVLGAVSLRKLSGCRKWEGGRRRVAGVGSNLDRFLPEIAPGARERQG